MLRAYDDYKPGFAAEVVEHVKEQSHHRQALERQRTEGSERRQGRAQTYAFVVAILSVLVSAMAASYSSFVAAVIVVVGVGGPAAATIVARILDRLTHGDPKP